LNLCHAIQTYLDEYEWYGLAWDIFWDYKHDMMTKILMAIWGEIPALDRYFVAGYRKHVGALPGRTIEMMLKLKRKYETDWREELANLPAKCRHTRRGPKNLIPVVRLIDMGLWYVGRE